MVTARRRPHNRSAKKTKPRKAKASGSLTKHMPIADIIAICPGADDVLLEYGIQCAGCALGGLESLEEGCRLHGLEDEEIAELLRELNRILTEQPRRPQTLTVTQHAASSLKRVMEEEGKAQAILIVTADGKGGFCMEFAEDLPLGHKQFSHPEEPKVRVAASILTLRRIGGSVIDYREDRFKLDLPEDQCDDCEKDVCDCGKNDVH